MSFPVFVNMPAFRSIIDNAVCIERHNLLRSAPASTSFHPQPAKSSTVGRALNLLGNDHVDIPISFPIVLICLILTSEELLHHALLDGAGLVPISLRGIL